MALFKRDRPTSLETEHERVRAIRIAAEQELGRLRRELVERVAAVESRERELADALARIRQQGGGGGREAQPDTDEAIAHAQSGLTAQARELKRQRDELAARERALLEMESDLARRAKGAQQTPEERLAHIEKRLEALQEAEKAFAKTRAELSARTEELDRREAAIAEQERAVAVGAAQSPGLSRAELDELDERLSRLERTTRDVGAAERGFGDGLRMLETKGLRGTPPGS